MAAMLAGRARAVLAAPQARFVALAIIVVAIRTVLRALRKLLSDVEHILT